MTEAQLIACLLVLTAVSVEVIIRCVRAILREMNGLGDEDESQAARRTEERKNERIRREIEKWGDGK